MRVRPAITAAGLFAALMAAAPAPAHHSFAMFDMNRKVTLVGSVTEFKWSNPHAWLSLSVPAANGATDHWAIEMTSPNNLVHQGWKRTSFKAGDKATIVVHPLRDGKNGGSLFSATTPDGTVLGSATGQEGSTDAK